MNAVKILGKFFAVIFASIFGILLFLLMSIAFIKGVLNESSIDKYINCEEIFNTKQDELFKSNNNQTIKEQIIEELSKSGVPKETTYNILENKELDRILSEYIYDYTEYILFNKEKPVLSSNEIITFINLDNSKLINNNLTLEQDEAINNYIISIVNKINKSTPTTQELINMGYDINLLQEITNIIFSVEIIIILIVSLIITSILIGICLMDKYKLFKTIAIPTIIVGLILIIGSIMEVKFVNMLINSNGIIDGIVLKITNETFKELLTYGISLIAIGIIILIAVTILSKLSKDKQFEVDNSVKETRSDVKESLKEHIAISDEDIDEINNTLTPKEIEEVHLPLENKTIKDEEIKITNDSELPKIEISSELVEITQVEVIPVKLNEPKIEKVEANEPKKDKKKEKPEKINNSEEKKEELVENQETQPLENKEQKVALPENNNKEEKDNSNEEQIDEKSELENQTATESEETKTEEKQIQNDEEILTLEKENKEEAEDEEIEIIEFNEENEQQAETKEEIELLEDEEQEEIELLEDEETKMYAKSNNKKEEDVELL